MEEQKLKEHVKAALRVTTDDIGINAEIKMLIGAAKADLAMSGIQKEHLDNEEIDDMIVLAITTYCKSKFGFDNPEKESLYEAFRILETHLALSSEYGAKDEK